MLQSDRDYTTRYTPTYNTLTDKVVRAVGSEPVKVKGATARASEFFSARLSF